MPSPPVLSPIRVLVSRPAGAAVDRTMSRLLARGYEPVWAPATVILRLDGEPPAGRFDALAVTSAQAVAAAGAARLGGFAHLPVFGVGDATAAALREFGFARVHVGGRDGAALAAAIARAFPTGGCILHVAARDRRPEPERSLQSGGFAVAIWEVYAAKAAASLPEAARAALASGEVEAALHYSRRSAAIVARLAAAAGLVDAFARLTHFALSDEAAGGLPDQGARGPIVAAEPTEAALLAALDRWADRAGSRRR